MDVGTAIIPGSERCRLTHTYNSYDFVEYCNSCNRGLVAHLARLLH